MYTNAEENEEKGKEESLYNKCGRIKFVRYGYFDITKKKERNSLLILTILPLTRGKFQFSFGKCHAEFIVMINSFACRKELVNNIHENESIENKVYFLPFFMEMKELNSIRKMYV